MLNMQILISLFRSVLTRSKSTSAKSANKEKYKELNCQSFLTMKSTIFAVLFVINVTIQDAYSLKPRGVRPDMGGFYDPNSMFHCLDGSDSITFDMVNDDYCDCKV